jgi:hypothetical protein
MIKLRHDFLIRPVSAGSTYLDYPFRKMLKLESFFIENDAYMVKKVKTAMKAFESKNPGRRFEIKKVEGGHRVWRTS